MAQEAFLYNKKTDEITECRLCAHKCLIKPGKFGICGVRENQDGILISHVADNIIACHKDPIEKKPLYHFFPGSDSYSIAAMGCNFKCSFCQNWQISQLNAREPGYAAMVHKIIPEDIVSDAASKNCSSISYTYTEPAVYFELAYNTAKIAHKQGLKNILVSNGFFSREAVEMILPYLDAANIDLKSFSNDFYKQYCGARLKPVLDTIRFMKEKKIWIEITTLIIGGLNDTEKELADIADFIYGIDPDIPWHISRFHPQYKFANHSPTPVESLELAYKIGKNKGLKYIYKGNIAADANTYCGTCNELLIDRSFYKASAINLDKGKCPQCSTTIAGIWQ